MRRFSRLLTTLASLALTAMLTQAPAMAASDVGTHAWSTDALTLRDGPGIAYDVTGEVVADVAISVLRCQKLWCLVDSGDARGWTNKDFIAFGRTSADWPGGINPNYATGGGSVCFYTGTNYTGSEFCMPFGRTIRDLALIGLDNSFSSVKIEGSTTVAACRDRDFQSYCERIFASQPALDPYLRRALTSIRIH